MINKNFVQRKITLIQTDLERLVPLAEDSFEEINSDFVKQAAVERLLERIINRAIDINQHIIAEHNTERTQPPLDYRETFLRLTEFGMYSKEFAERIGKSIGTRNILAHEYDKIDNELIYRSMGDCLKDYTEYCGYILKFLEE
jgi:uncharacterized protein YutE (UPF0331/DUF86 family)